MPEKYQLNFKRNSSFCKEIMTDTKSSLRNQGVNSTGSTGGAKSLNQLIDAAQTTGMTSYSEKVEAPVGKGIKVKLEESDLWKRFHKCTNEMIVTKTGRRMFPVMSASISGLDPDAMYSILLDFSATDDHRWKYVNGEWVPGGKPENAPPSSAYVHPDSPNFGAHWMKQSVGFSKVKLSNKLNGSGQVMLNSLHKYEPRIHIIRVGGREKQKLVGTYSFQETRFIAVTAYQNEDITQLKIKYNPFAKAFLDVKEKSDGFEFFDDPQQSRYPQLGGWFLPGAGTMCGPSPHQLAPSFSLPSHTGCERLSSLSRHRSAPYPSTSPYHQKYPNGYSSDGSPAGLSLLPHESWPSLGSTAPSMSSSCSQYTPVWPQMGNSSFPSVSTTSPFSSGFICPQYPSSSASSVNTPPMNSLANTSHSPPSVAVESPNHLSVTDSGHSIVASTSSCSAFQETYPTDTQAGTMYDSCGYSSLGMSHHQNTGNRTSWVPIAPPSV